MRPVAFLISEGATPRQASAVIWGTCLSVAVPLGLWFVDRTVAQVVLIVLAVAIPRAIFGLVAQWGRSGGGSALAEAREWRALQGYC
jgi:hypothetical protein